MKLRNVKEWLENDFCAVLVKVVQELFGAGVVFRTLEYLCPRQGLQAN